MQREKKIDILEFDKKYKEMLNETRRQLVELSLQLGVPMPEENLLPYPECLLELEVDDTSTPITSCRETSSDIPSEVEDARSNITDSSSSSTSTTTATVTSDSSSTVSFRRSFRNYITWLYNSAISLPLYTQIILFPLAFTLGSYSVYRLVRWSVGNSSLPSSPSSVPPVDSVVNEAISSGSRTWYGYLLDFFKKKPN